MKSPSISSPDKRTGESGISVIEILLVMGIVSVIAAFSMSFSLDSYREYSFRNSRDMLVSVLEKARSQSINNICLGSACSNGKSHGVHLQSGSYVIFQGPNWAGRDTNLDETIQIDSPAIQISGTDIVFLQLSGDTSSAGGTITMSDITGHISVITANAEGRIAWTN
jgi:Tfp pilus assembly protein FimT